MAGKQTSFEEQVLSARAQDRDRFGKALADARGPAPFSKELSEQQQDEMWLASDPQYRDPAAFAMLTAPREQGGQGLTPLAASYLKYPHRQLLVEGAGAGIDEQIKYADMRRKRMLERPAPEPEPMAPPTAPIAAPEQPMPQPAPAPMGGGMAEQAQPTPAPGGSY